MLVVFNHSFFFYLILLALLPINIYAVINQGIPIEIKVEKSEQDTKLEDYVPSARDFLIDNFKKYEGTSKISEKYFSGEYLIYDCVNRSYICVDKDGYDYCKNLRTEDWNNKQVFLRCAPLHNFNETILCLDELYNKIETITDKSFCLRL